MVGDPIEHSLSPVIFNHLFEIMGLNKVMLAFRVSKGQGRLFLKASDTLNIEAFSVTMPIKDEIARFINLTNNAKELRSVNSVWRKNGSFVGDSTDGQGFVEAFKYCFNKDPKNLVFVIYGTGGAAKALCLSLNKAGAKKIMIASRDSKKAKLLAKKTKASYADQELSELLKGADVFVNATPLGMAGPYIDVSPLKLTDLTPNLTIVDLVYNPIKTKLIKLAEKRDLMAASGLAMLIFQAKISFENWFGKEPPVEEMFKIAQREITLK